MLAGRAEETERAAPPAAEGRLVGPVATETEGCVHRGFAVGKAEGMVARGALAVEAAAAAEGTVVAAMAVRPPGYRSSSAWHPG